MNYLLDLDIKSLLWHLTSTLAHGPGSRTHFFIGGFLRPGEQILFFDGLRTQFGINARRAEKQQFFIAVAVGAVDDVVLDLQILIL